MPAHEYYEQLCALATTGQLSADELADFNSHLNLCPNCRSAISDFQIILRQLPAVEKADFAENIADLQSRSYRERFLKRAEREGIVFPAEVRQLTVDKRVRRTVIPAWCFALAGAACLLLAVTIWFRQGMTRHGAVTPPQAMLQSATGAASVVQPRPDTRHDVDVLDKKVHDLQQQSALLNSMIATLARERDSYRDQAEIDKAAIAQLDLHLQQLQQATNRNQAELDQLRNEKSQAVAALVEQQMQLNEAREQIKVRDAALEQERQLSAAAKDVRELMGARNLHIIDVADVDSRGRSRKAMGRVFFVENTSLIFYAFDLAAAERGKKVLFQAWGHREGSSAKPRNLGVFRLDDHAQQRWVLRVKDPKLLAGIDSVFVTVEAGPQADQPSGRKLVYAYLGTEPNHP